MKEQHGKPLNLSLGKLLVVIIGKHKCLIRPSGVYSSVIQLDVFRKMSHLSYAGGYRYETLCRIMENLGRFMVLVESIISVVSEIPRKCRQHDPLRKAFTNRRYNLVR